MRIIIPAAFTARHHDALTRYLADDRLLSPAEWQSLYQGINILDTAQVQTDVEAGTFRQLYHRYIDARFATSYLERLLALVDVEAQSPALIAEFARRIAPHLQQASLLLPDVPPTWLFYTYCVYWWQNFARAMHLKSNSCVTCGQAVLNFTPTTFETRSSGVLWRTWLY